MQVENYLLFSEFEQKLTLLRERARGKQHGDAFRQKEKELPGPPSSHVPSEAWTQLLSQHA